MYREKDVGFVGTGGLHEDCIWAATAHFSIALSVHVAEPEN